MDPKKILDFFIGRFSGNPRIFRSPGRINIIGEHTDYNNGFVLPAAVDKDICIAIRKNEKGLFRIFSIDTDELIEFTSDTLEQVHSGWPDYILGVIVDLKKKGHSIEPFDCVFGGDIPLGAGMSSSAALASVTTYALNSIFKLGLDKIDIIKTAQRAEIDYAGLNCGIMDQFASVLSKKNEVIKLDCKDLSYESAVLNDENIEFILVNSMVKHKLADSAYNDRRNDCEQAVKILNEHYHEVESLRDVNIKILEEKQAFLSKNQYNRAVYIINENERVSDAVKALHQNEFDKLGTLMNQSHAGLRDQYEVSCEELDFLQAEALKIKGVLGSRMMGGGFGGCTINLIERKNSDEFLNTISNAFEQKYAQIPAVYPVKTADGSSELILAP